MLTLWDTAQNVPLFWVSVFLDIRAVRYWCVTLWFKCKRPWSWCWEVAMQGKKNGLHLMHNDKQEEASYTQETHRETQLETRIRWRWRGEWHRCWQECQADTPERRMGQIQTDRRQRNPVTAATQLTSTQTWDHILWQNSTHKTNKGKKLQYGIIIFCPTHLCR